METSEKGKKYNNNALLSGEVPAIYFVILLCCTCLLFGEIKYVSR